jgi:hypothetical protein
MAAESVNDCLLVFVAPKSSIACINHVLFSLGGSIGMGFNSMVTLNLLVFSDIDLSHEWVMWFWYFPNGLLNG